MVYQERTYSRCVYETAPSENNKGHWRYEGPAFETPMSLNTAKYTSWSRKSQLSDVYKRQAGRICFRAMSLMVWASMHTVLQ